MSLLPPPPGVYSSRDALLDAVRAWAAAHGYAVTIGSSYQGKIYLKCDRGGVYRNRHNLTNAVRRRDTGSRLTGTTFDNEKDIVLTELGCLFSVVGSLKADSWELDVRHGDHNHEASKNQVAHPSLRRLTTEQKADIVGLTRAGATPRTIISALRQSQEGEVPITVKDIYNARQQIRTETLAGRTTISALAEHLDAERFIWQVKTTDQGHITHHFFAAHTSLTLYEQYPDVL